MSETKTQEQIAAEPTAAKTAAAAAKAEAKAKADAAKAEAKAIADKAKAEAKEKAEAAKAEAKKAKEEAAAKVKAEKEAKAKLDAEAKAAAAATKVKVQQPQNNGVTRPRPDGACGKVWAIADTISARIGQPVPISMLQKETSAAGLNDATCRTQYARWKTFNGVFGAVAKPAEAVAAAPAEGQAA